METTRVALLGTGIMGSAMARNLVRADFSTTVWNRSPEAAAATGARSVASPDLAVRDAQVVITMLPSADVVNAVMFDGRVVDALAPRAVWAQMGTIGVAATLEIAARLRKLRPDVRFVDAPVSGSKGPATTGRLLVLGSGPPDAEAIVAPVFAAVASKTMWLGEAGQGSRMKLVVNAYLSIVIEGVAEALELADRLGIGEGQFAEAIGGGPLDAPIVAAKVLKMTRGEFSAEFPLQWALKDVDLALAEAGAGPPPLLAALSPQWHAAVDAGLGREDISAARVALRRTRT